MVEEKKTNSRKRSELGITRVNLMEKKDLEIVQDEKTTI